MPSLSRLSKTSIFLALITGVTVIGFAGYIAYKNGIFASTSSASACTIKLDGQIQYDRVGPANTTPNRTLVYFYSGNSLLRNVNRDSVAYVGGSSNSVEIAGGGKGAYAIGHDVDNNQIKSNTFDCSGGNILTVKADFRKTSPKITVSQISAGTGSLQQDDNGEPETDTPPTGTSGAGSTGGPIEPGGDNSDSGSSTRAGEVRTGGADLTRIGTVKLFVYTEVDNQRIPVNTAYVTASINIPGAESATEPDKCITGTNGTCDLNLYKPSKETEVLENYNVLYTAEKAGLTGKSNRSVAESLANGIDILIPGLTESDASDYKDWSEKNTQERLTIPTTGGFTPGNSSIIIIPSRYTRGGGQNNLTGIGAVNFKLDMYYNPDNPDFEASDGVRYLSPSRSLYYTSSQTIRSAFGNLTKKTFSGIIPDNGKNSQLEIIGLHAGFYSLKLDKASNFLPSIVEFQLSSDEQRTIPVNMRPRQGAEPPSAPSTAVRKYVQFDTYWMKLDGKEYIYEPKYPWYGWQPQDQIIRSEPSYSIDTNYVPQIMVGENTQNGYNAPFGVSPDDFADYMRRCQTMNFESGIDAEDAALAAAIAGFGSWISGDNKNLESFTESTLIPGLATYFAAQAMEKSGGIISISNTNGNCFPTTSPYFNQYPQNQYPYSGQYQYPYYPNGYPTNRIPSECLPYVTGTPPIMYDPDWVPQRCREYLNFTNYLPLLGNIRF